MNKNMIERMWYLQCWSGYVEFKQIFKTEHMAKHLWGKYEGLDNNLLQLWKQLDVNNQQLLLDYFNSDEFDSRYKKAMVV